MRACSAGDPMTELIPNLLDAHSLEASKDMNLALPRDLRHLYATLVSCRCFKRASTTGFRVWMTGHGIRALHSRMRGTTLQREPLPQNMRDGCGDITYGIHGIQVHEKHLGH